MMRTTTEAVHEFYSNPPVDTEGNRKTATEAQRAFWAGYDAAMLDVEEAAENKHSHWADY